MFFKSVVNARRHYYYAGLSGSKKTLLKTQNFGLSKEQQCITLDATDARNFVQPISHGCMPSYIVLVIMIVDIGDKYIVKRL